MYRDFSVLDMIPSATVVAVDTETTGLNWLSDRVFGIAVSVYIEGRIHTVYIDTRLDPGIAQRLEYQLQQSRCPIVNHHIKFDIHMLRQSGVAVPVDRAECTMIRAALIDEHLRSYSLEYLGQKYVGAGKVDSIYERLAAMFGGRATRNAQMPNLHRAPIDLVAPYAAGDSELALQLWLWQEGEIERQELHTVWDLERRLFPHIVEMERCGIRVDLDVAERQHTLVSRDIEYKTRALHREAGFEVNPNPSGSLTKLFDPRQSADGVWRSRDGTVLAQTPGGKPSICADALERMVDPMAAKILELRKMMRVCDTFIGGHIMGHASNGRVHPNINQTKGDDTGGTGTGRLSYTNPALQQIPSRDRKAAAMVRPIFVPEEGHGWSYGDLDQHELRIFHHYVNNPKVMRVYRDDPDTDGHQAVADLTGLPRNAPKSGGANAKQLNLAMVFNMGGGAVAQKMGLPYTVEIANFGGQDREFLKPGPEAQEVIDRYYEMMPGVREIAKTARSIAKSRGYVKTLFGRHIRFPGGEFTYKASGLVYQGTAADLNKDNIVRICEFLRSEGNGARLLLNIHDEYSISLPFDGHRRVLSHLKSVLQDRPQLRVPLRIDFSSPESNWWDATCAGVVTKGS